jgi:hypothetical protein
MNDETISADGLRMDAMLESDEATAMQTAQTSRPMRYFLSGNSTNDRGKL